MKNFFHPESESYTEEAMNLDSRTIAAIRDIFAEYQNQGYSIRDICYIMEGAINEWSLIQLLNKRCAGEPTPAPTPEL